MSDIKSCTYCGKQDNLRAFDLTEKLFCSLQDFQNYYKEKNINNVVQSHDLLNVQEILNINATDNAFIKELPLDDERALKICEERILTLRRLQQSLRVSDNNVKKHVMKIREKQEAEKVTRYRSKGCNSDLEIKEKKLSKIGKMITSYKKMNMSNDLIMDTILAVTGGKMSREEITKEIESL